MKTRILLTIVLSGLMTAAFGQNAPSWDNWSWLEGEWTGEGSGRPGEGAGSFSFKFDLDRNILIRKSHSEYPASENKPRIIHDDLMIVYPDNTGIPSRAIYFDNEGHIINYTIEYTSGSIIFTSEKTGNVPVFRLTYTLLGDDIVNTKFEMSQDGEKFINYIEGKSRKVN
jgi:hypothetical protein